MDVQGSVMLPGDQATVWELLQDPEVLRKSVPGCESLDPVGEDQYTAELSIGVAAIKGKYKGNMSIVDKQPPNAFKLNVDGKGAPGWVKATMNFDLVPQGQETEVKYKIDAQVGGLIAAVGNRMLSGVAKMLLGDMFKRLHVEAQARQPQKGEQE